MLKDSPWKATLEDLVRKQATIITLFLAGIILLTGITLVENPSRWWLAPLVLGGLLLALLIFLNARVVIKAITAFIIVLMLSSWAFKIGSLGALSYGAGSIWLFSTLLSFFLILTISYLRQSAQSRWLRGTFAVLVGFIATYAMAASGLFMEAAGPLGVLVSILVFLPIYYLGGKNRFSPEKMPKTYLDEETFEALASELRPRGWGVKRLEKKHAAGALLWNDKYAFVVSKVLLDQKFGLAGSAKKPYLSYKGENINPWLSHLTHSLTPSWGLKGAPVTLVLLDEKDTNDKAHKTIGVQVPDSKAVIPVGILPAKDLLKRKNFVKLVETLESNWRTYAQELKPKQVIALDLLLPPQEEKSAAPEEAIQG